MSATPVAEPVPRQRIGVVVAWSLILFALCLVLHTKHADFPYFYHPDEPGKVEQILTGKWNFHHPMLLLATTQLAASALHVTPAEQPIVETGRFVSAVFMALATVALSLLAYAWRGWPAAVASGLALAVHHQLFELAHYMKEDGALLMGIALTFLTAYATFAKPNPVRTLLLGAACALAISGKYVGVMMLAIALPVCWSGHREGRAARLGSFAAGLLSTLLLVNLPLLAHWELFRECLGREVHLVVEGQGKMTRSVPHAQYWNVFIDNTTPAVWALLLAFLAARWRERRALTSLQWTVIAFPFAYAVMLSFSPKDNDRYFLPATAMFVLLAALGVSDLADWFRGKCDRRVVVVGAVLILVGAQLPSWWRYERAFQHDDNAEMIAWVRTNLPPDAVIAKDSRVGLPESKKPRAAAWHGPIPQRVLADKFAADVAERTGTVDELRQIGVTHVAVSQSDYGRFALKSLHPQKDEEQTFSRRKAFYEQLFREGELLFERPRGTVIYLHPGIRIYRIPVHAANA